MTISPYKKNFGLPDSVIESVKSVLAKPKPVVVEDNKPKIKYDLNGKPVIMEEAEQIEEGRGRPRKTPLAAGEDEGNEPDQNIIMQLRKAVSMKGMKPVKFQNGEKHNISPAKAIAVLRIHTGLKSSIEKGNFEKKLAHSHDSFMKHSAAGANHGEAPEKKSRITLPAVNRLKLRKPIED